VQRPKRRWSAPARGVAAITSGALLGQLILVVATPILSRIYSPESFGHFSVVLGVTAIVGPAAALKFESALLLPADEDGARRLLRLGMASAVGTSVMSGLVVWLGELVGLGRIWAGLSLAPMWVAAMVLATATFSVLSQAALRRRDYSAVARRGPIQSLATAGGQLGLGLLVPSAPALLGGQLIGRALGYVALFRSTKPLLERPISGSFLDSLREYWKFPLVFAPSSVLNSLGGQLPLIVIAAWFGPAAAGELGIAQRVVFIPAALLGASLAQVIGAELSLLLREGRGNGRQIYLWISARIAVMAAGVALTLIFVAPSLLPFVLGEEWRHSGLFAQAMAVSVGLGLIASPLSQVYVIYQSLASIVVDVSRVALLTISAAVSRVAHLDAVETTWLFYGAQSINYLVTWMYGLRIVSRAVVTVRSNLS
jgi:O-antigen/teichoic acid export membrane protein